MHSVHLVCCRIEFLFVMKMLILFISNRKDNPLLCDVNTTLGKQQSDLATVGRCLWRVVVFLVWRAKIIQGQLTTVEPDGSHATRLTASERGGASPLFGNSLPSKGKSSRLPLPVLSDVSSAFPPLQIWSKRSPCGTRWSIRTFWSCMKPTTTTAPSTWSMNSKFPVKSLSTSNQQRFSRGSIPPHVDKILKQLLSVNQTSARSPDIFWKRFSAPLERDRCDFTLVAFRRFASLARYEGGFCLRSACPGRFE